MPTGGRRKNRTSTSGGARGRESETTEAQMSMARLNLEEVRITGREPRDEVSAPPIPNRDFVQERLAAGMSITQAALDTAKSRLQAAQRRVNIGLAQPGDADALRAEIVGLESALAATQQKIAARQAFVANKYDPALTDLRVGEIEAEQQLRALAPQLDLAKRDMARIESLVTKGLASPADVAQARVRVLEVELKLSMAQAELSTVRARIAERNAGKERRQLERAELRDDVAIERVEQLFAIRVRARLITT